MGRAYRPLPRCTYELFINSQTSKQFSVDRSLLFGDRFNRHKFRTGSGRLDQQARHDNSSQKYLPADKAITPSGRVTSIIDIPARINWRNHWFPLDSLAAILVTFSNIHQYKQGRRGDV